MAGAINGIEMSLLLDTGAAVALLREEAWSRVIAKEPQDLRPWSTVTLVSAGGTPLTIHGSACVELELEGKKFMTEIVVVSPLTSEAILGLNFLQEQQAVIDLGGKRLHLKASGCDIPLGDPTTLRECTIEQQVRAARTVEVPPCSMLEIAGSVKVAVEGVWLMEGIANKRLPVHLSNQLLQLYRCVS